MSAAGEERATEGDFCLLLQRRGKTVRGKKCPRDDDDDDDAQPWTYFSCLLLQMNLRGRRAELADSVDKS